MKQPSRPNPPQHCHPDNFPKLLVTTSRPLVCKSLPPCGVCSKPDKPACQPQATRTVQASYKGQYNCPAEILGSITHCNFVLAVTKSGLLGHLNIHGLLIICASGRVVLGTTRPSHSVAVLLYTLTASQSGPWGHLDIQTSLAVISVARQCTKLLDQTRLDGLLHGTSSKAP